MLLENESYDNFNHNDINNLSKFNYKFLLNERFIHVKDKNGNYFECQTPFLKVLKPIHVTLNKKKTVAKKYLILETNDELDFNNQIGEFMFIINKIHEISQEKIKEKSMEWFNTEFDEIGLDIKVRRPIDQQKESEFIRICIPSNIENEISKLLKGTYVLCNIIFKGLKVSNDYINEEWEILDIITQEKYDEEQNEELINNTIVVDALQTLLDSDINNIYEIDNIDNIDNIKVINEENKICNDENIYIENSENKININENQDLLCEDIISENIENNINIDQNSIEYYETNTKENIEKNAKKDIEKNQLNKELNNITNNLNNIVIDENKVKKDIKKNKIIGEKIKENKIIKNNKKHELIKKLSKKIVFN